MGSGGRGGAFEPPAAPPSFQIAHGAPATDSSLTWPDGLFVAGCLVARMRDSCRGVVAATLMPNAPRPLPATVAAAAAPPVQLAVAVTTSDPSCRSSYSYTHAPVSAPAGIA